jgi:hypothetical protein
MHCPRTWAFLQNIQPLYERLEDCCALSLLNDSQFHELCGLQCDRNSNRSCQMVGSALLRAGVAGCPSDTEVIGGAIDAFAIHGLMASWGQKGRRSAT